VELKCKRDIVANREISSTIQEKSREIEGLDPASHMQRGIS
jgi:hypothetical protein